MLFGLFTLFVALVISAVAAYYSIVGLTAIFSAAVIPIIIMGAALEVGKVTAAVWLKMYWDRASITYKLYLVPAVAFLMLLTSMGIFGFLSKAHSDQSLVSGDSQAKVAIYDEKIRTAKDNIDANRRALKQMDEAVDQVMGRSTDEKGADKAVAIRRAQQKERVRLQSEIVTEQKTIAVLNEEAAPLRAEFRKVEAEVGPIKYIAALIYDDNPDNTVLEKAVRFVIIIIVAVFDPLALVLILAAQQSIRWAKQDAKLRKNLVSIYDNSGNDEPQTTSMEIPKKEPEDPSPAGWMFDKSKHPYLDQPFAHFENMQPLVGKEAEQQNQVKYEQDDGPLTQDQIEQLRQLVQTPLSVETQPEEPSPKKMDVVDSNPSFESLPAASSKFAKIPETAKRHKVEQAAVPATLNINKIGLQADNIEGNAAHSDFGTKFPENAEKGHMFLRVDHLPNKLFKYNGHKWIEVDKSKTDSYSYDEQYILFLIDKLQSGEYELDQLSASEQELVVEKLQQIANDKT